MAQEIYVKKGELPVHRIKTAELALNAASVLLKGVCDDPEYRDGSGKMVDLYPNSTIDAIVRLNKRIKAIESNLEEYARIMRTGPEELERIDGRTVGRLTTWNERVAHQREGLGRYFLSAANTACGVGIPDLKAVFHPANAIARHQGIDTARIGAEFLDMEESYYGSGVYHSDVGCWQRAFGYTDLYDKVFDAATSCEPKKYPFKYNGTEYILWGWKGNYLNLGAGGELGIYRGGEPWWEADRALSMEMSMKLRYANGEEILTHEADTWWVTGFNSNPEHLNVEEEDLRATFQVRFDDPGMYEAFAQEWNGKQGWRCDPENRTASVTF